MIALLELQASFAAALYDGGGPVVHAATLRRGLVEALGAIHPVTRRLVGDDFFAGVAWDWARHHPPVQPILAAYGQGFAAWLGRHPAVAGLPYLGNVAALEWARNEALHAAEAEPLTDLAGLDVARADALVPRLHPALRWLRTDTPALEIWRAHQDAGDPTPVDLGASGADLLVSRPHAQVGIAVLPPGGLEFLNAVADGTPLAALVVPDLGALLARGLRDGWFTAFTEETAP